MTTSIRPAFQTVAWFRYRGRWQRPSCSIGSKGAPRHGLASIHGVGADRPTAAVHLLLPRGDAPHETIQNSRHRPSTPKATCVRVCGT